MATRSKPNDGCLPNNVDALRRSLNEAHDNKKRVPEKLCDFGRGMVAAASIAFHHLRERQTAFEILKYAGVDEVELRDLPKPDRETVKAFRLAKKR